MNLQIQALTEAYCREICSWSYPEPYGIYNWPAWEIMTAQELEFADPNIREAQFAAVVIVPVDSISNQHHSELIGYVQYFPMVGVTRIGLGIRPELCDNGLGAAFMEVIIKEAIKRNPANEIDLEVHTWNVRAQKTYTGAGFEQTDEYERMTPTGMGRFYCMVYKKP